MELPDALHKKWAALTTLQPDIAVVPEAGSPQYPATSKLFETARSHAWVGPNERKGLAAVSFGNYALDPLPHDADERPDALALKVFSPSAEFILIAVWARPRNYVRNLHDMLDAYEPHFQAHDVVLAGDFNSNAVWDHLHGAKCHSRLVARLDELGLVSAYHFMRSEPHGAETEPTFFHHKNERRPYHLDYVFLPRSWNSRLLGCNIGDAATWLTMSDHVPMTVELAPSRQAAQQAKGE